MASLWAGYHIMEKKLVEDLAEDLNVQVKHISIVQFLRKTGIRSLRGTFVVHGLEEAAKIWDRPENFGTYLRRKLRAIVEQMIQGSCTVIFIVENEHIIGEERPLLIEGRLSLAKIFGADRLERISKGHFYSTPNIP